MLYLLKRSRRRKLNSKISFLQKNPVFKAKPSRRPQSLCVKLTKLPPYDEITRFDGMFTVVHCMLQFAIPQYQHQPLSFDKFFSLKYFFNRPKNA
jgi:hypothetical protein